MSSWDGKKRRRLSLSGLMSNPNQLHALTQNSGNMGRMAALSQLHWWLLREGVSSQHKIPLICPILSGHPQTHMPTSNISVGSVGSMCVYKCVCVHIHTYIPLKRKGLKLRGAWKNWKGRGGVMIDIDVVFMQVNIPTPHNGLTPTNSHAQAKSFPSFL